jgi:hypothetical protein
MNESEKIVYEYLKSKGFSEEQIICNENVSPNFLAFKNVEKFEVKQANNNNEIYFSDLQRKNFKNETIVVVKDKNIFCEFKWTERKKAEEKYGIKIKILSSNLVTIRLSKELISFLKEYKNDERETYDMVIRRVVGLLD